MRAQHCSVPWHGWASSLQRPKLKWASTPRWLRLPCRRGSPSSICLQNLIVLCTLSPSTAHMAPMLASLLLKLYALSIAPVSLWVSAWATWLHVAVA